MGKPEQIVYESGFIENVILPRCTPEAYKLVSGGRLWGAVKIVPANDGIVRHGRWIVHTEHFSPYQKCSVCGFEIPIAATESEEEICLYKYCPDCAARMDGGNPD